MRLTLPQIETFYWIARLGSFHAAARQLNITQPTVSVRMRELEKELDSKLFLRNQGRARLSAEGLAVLTHAERILASASEMKREALPGGGLRGLLRLGVIETVARLALPEILAHVADRHAELRVELTVDIGTTLSRRQNGRELDVIIATDPQPSDQVRSELIGAVELAWIASPRHRLAHSVVGPGELRNERIFSHPKGSTTYQLVEAWFRPVQVEPMQLNVCNSLSAMVELVTAGLGLAVVTPALCRREMEAGLVVHLRANPPVPNRPLFLCCLRETWSEEIVELAALVRRSMHRFGALTE